MGRLCPTLAAAARLWLCPTLAAAAWLWLCPGLPARAQVDEPRPAGPDCADAAVARVQRRYEGMRDLRARFEQTSLAVALGSAGAPAATASRGRVWFAKPGRMRWSYEAPEPSLVVSDGETLWVYDPTRAEAHRMPVDEGFLSGTAIQFLLGQGDLRVAFHVEARRCDPGAWELELRPRQPATYERLRLRIDAASGDVLETGIVDLLGNETRVAFSEIEVDAGAGPELFRFDAPEGVRVIDLGAPATGSEE